MEIKEAPWSIENNKAPRVDGFNSFIFKKAWNIISHEITIAIQTLEWKNA